MILSYSLSANESYSNENADSNLIVEAQYNNIEYDIKGHKSAKGKINYINLFLPFGADITDINVTFSDGTVENFDLSSPIQVSIMSTSINRMREYTLRAFVSDLPALYLNIDESRGSIVKMNSSPDHSVFCYGEYNFTTLDGNNIFGTLSMRGRGNATWGLEKKPYHLRLDEKADLLGSGDARAWVLLANHGDRSLIRGKLVYDMAHEIGLEYSIESEYVDVFMNGEYLGNYMLCEKVQINKNRVDIKNGYLLEYDTRGQSEEYYFRAPLTEQFVVIKDPEDVSNTLLNEIKSYINGMERAIAASNGVNSDGKHYSEYMDVESSIKIYWLNEIVKNGDYGMGSTFYYKEPDTILYAGPAWDFDIVMANATSNFGAPTEIKSNNLASPTGWWLRMVNELSDKSTSLSIQRHLFAHEDYRKASIDLYFSTIREPLHNMLDEIRNYEKLLQQSATMNFIRWDVLEQGHTWQTPNQATTYKGEVDFIYNFMSERIDWIDRTMNSEYEDYYGYPYDESVVETNTDITETIIQNNTEPISDSVSNNYVFLIMIVIGVVIIAIIGFVLFLRKRQAIKS